MLTESSFESKTIEIVKDKLYWISSDRTPKIPKTYFFNVDNDLVYEPLSSDFGPLDIGQTGKFVLELKKLLNCPQFSDNKIYHHTSTDYAKRANAAFLMGAFQIIELNKTAEEAWEPFSKVKPEFVAFRDASDGSCDYKCTIQDCLKGLESAIKLGWFNLKKFDLKCYEQHAKVDLNWIIPGKLLAFSEPFEQSKDKDGSLRFVPEDYTPVFKKLRVKTIIRLNSKNYDKQRFTQSGFKHFDLDISETWCPNDEQIEEFIKICEEEKGVVAVHCKSGLGHTATMIACYAMKCHKFLGAEVIAWVRLCRPGSILGKQQKFIVRKEEHLCGRTRKPIVCLSELCTQDLEINTETAIRQQQPYISKSPNMSPTNMAKMKQSNSI